MCNYRYTRVKYAHEPPALLLRLLLVCTLVALRAPVAQPPILRIPTQPFEYNATTSIHHQHSPDLEPGYVEGARLHRCERYSPQGILGLRVSHRSMGVIFLTLNIFISHSYLPYVMP